ncbi:MAG: sigma-70 family RNA polymerase sigma factor [Eubacterium sp.]|nr:sigma-70 family RNA polymerase sigma factor [Eubacterium sp.]
MIALLIALADTPDEKRKIEQLYERYNRLLYVVAYRVLGNHEDAEDAVFFSWEKIIKHLDQVPDLPAEIPDGRAQEADGDAAAAKDCQKVCNKIKAFLVTIVERTSIDMYRKKKRHAEVGVDELEETPFVAVRENAYDDTEVRLVLEKLPKKYAEVMLLYFVYEMSYQEIADALSLSMSAVASRVMRGKEKLREILS